MENLKLIESGNKTLLKQGNKILGYVALAKNGYSYNIGKPSDENVASFTKNSNTEGFTLLEAKARLMQAFIKN